MKNLFRTVFLFFAMQYSYGQVGYYSVKSSTPITFEEVENQPVFPGGINEFIKFVGKNFKAPEDENFKGGTLRVSFVIETDGQITNPKVINDLGFGTDAEIKRVLSLSPRWTSGDQGGQKVRVLYTLPVTIRI